MPDKPETNSRVRLDKWLWAARFFKTRGLATEAVSGGKVHLNGARIKPSRSVSIGDQLSIQKGDIQFDIEVLALSSRRGPASEAQQLYRESDESVARREEERATRRAAALAGQIERLRRPEGRERRRARDQRRRFR